MLRHQLLVVPAPLSNFTGTKRDMKNAGYIPEKEGQYCSPPKSKATPEKTGSGNGMEIDFARKFIK